MPTARKLDPLATEHCGLTLSFVGESGIDIIIGLWRRRTVVGFSRGEGPLGR